jgi:mannosyl-3-phosphoglycerate phosphatase
MAREYDEPFLLDDDGYAEAVAAAAQTRGLRVTRGGRFWHLTGDNDKGRALFTLLGLWGAEGCRWSVVALGDSPNDLALLQAAHRPIVVPRAESGLDPALAAALPRAERAPGPGPAGWNAALLSVLAGDRLPLVGDGA